MKTTSRRSAKIQFGALIASAGTVPQLIGSELVNKNILPEYQGVPGRVRFAAQMVALRKPNARITQLKFISRIYGTRVILIWRPAEKSRLDDGKPTDVKK